MASSNDGNLFALAAMAWRHRLLVGCCTVLGLSLGVAYYLLVDRVYESQIVVQPARDVEESLNDISRITSQLGSVASLVGLSPSRGSRYDQAVALLTSEGFFYELDNRIGFRDALRERVESKFLGRFREAELMPIGRAHNLFHQKYFRLIEDPTTTVVWLRIRSWDPQISADWINEVVSYLNEVMSAKDRSLSQHMLEYLEHELDMTKTVETRQAVSALIRREFERKMLANVTKEYAFEVIDSARPSDAGDFIAPSLGVCLVFGFALGMMAGVSVVILRH